MMTAIVRLFFIVFVALIPFARQADSEWRVIDVTALPEPAGYSYMGLDYLVSPDGSSLTWIDADGINANNKICLMALPSNVRLCHAIPPTYSTPSLLSWSPDSRYIVLLDGILSEVSTVFIFEPATDDFLLVKGKQIFRSQVVWSAASDAVFYLTYHNVEDNTSTALYRFSRITATDTAYDLTDIFGMPTIIDGLVAVSDDDSRFVVLLRHNAPPDFTPGLWLMDIHAQTAEHLVSDNDLEIGVRPGAIGSFSDGDLVWDQQRERLLVTTHAPGPPYMTMSVLSIDPESGDITPLLSPDETLADYPGFQGGTIMPDGEFFLYFADLVHEPPYQKTIFAVPLASLPGTADHAPITVQVTDEHPIDCLPVTALITLEHADGSQRRYVYEPHIFCPG